MARTSPELEKTKDRQVFLTAGMALLMLFSFGSLAFSMMAWRNSLHALERPMEEPPPPPDTQALIEVNKMRVELANFMRNFDNQQRFVRQLQNKVEGLDLNLTEVKVRVGDTAATHGTPMKADPEALAE